jgi:multidrug resistance protein, MATE family
MSDERARAPVVPARRVGRDGRPQVDYRAIWLLAGPLIANSAVQAVLNLTDTWFIGQLSTAATAAMASIYWLVLCAVLLLGGVGMAVQTVVAQAYGAGRRARAAQAAWSGLAGSLLTVPLFVLVGLAGAPVLAWARVDPGVQALALSYWWPRLVAGGPLALLVWSLTSFFNGTGRTRITLIVTVVMSVTNALFNQWFMFGLGMGMAGSAWGTVAAEALGLVVALGYFLGPQFAGRFRTRLTWRRLQVRRQFALGLPMGLTSTGDMVGLAIFQLMLVNVGTAAGAATQIVIMLSSLCYMPGYGIALSGTTLVGQAIGAGDRAWAGRVGGAVIGLVVAYMGGAGLALALATPALAPWFVRAGDPHAQDVLTLITPLMWIAAGYQVFDGLNLGSGFCLRGAGDVRVPAVLVAALAWLGWIPLTQSLTFAPGQGFIPGLPQFGFGAVGAWVAALVYVVALGLALYARWRSGAWRRIRLGV